MAFDGTKLWVTNSRRNLDKVRNILLRYNEIKQVEIEDARLATEVTSMLMGSEVPPRKQFIYAHADEAEIDA